MDTYDAILSLIPVVGGAGGVAGFLYGLPEALAVVGGATLALVLVLYALFGDPPIDPALGPHQ